MTCVVLAFNFWEHLPIITPSHYSDISSIYWRDGIGKGVHGFPYLNYVFEYPVIVGVLVYLCSYFGRAMSDDFGTSMAYYTVPMNLALSLFALGTVYLLYKLVELRRGEMNRIFKYFIIAPSFLMFTTYNWDIIAIFFSTLTIYLYLRGRRHLSSLSLGLGIAAKIYPAVLLPVFLLEEKTWKDRIIFFFTSTGLFAVLNMPFILLNFNVWWGTWQHHMNWGLENSWLIYLFNQMDQNAHYASLAVMLYLVYKGLTETSTKIYESQGSRILERSLLMSLAWLVGSYVVPPQMALMLLPFMVLVPVAPLWMFYLAEIFNSLIIVLWFTPQLNLGNPLVASSPVQVISGLRQLIWFTFFLMIIYPGKLRSYTHGLLERIR
ncbi:MAG: glycosyltransferase 87 family protein [archaeon]